jgi:hypothetical protein
MKTTRGEIIQGSERFVTEVLRDLLLLLRHHLACNGVGGKGNS